MTMRIGTMAAACLLATSLPLAAQERAAPHERIERLRLERLHDALGLTDEQTETLRRQMERSHEAMRMSYERQRQAMEALELSLTARPPDEDALRRALTEVESARAAMEREREQHMAELSRTLTLEQRAKFLLFNRHFDARLRELVEQRRSPTLPRTPGGFRMRVVPPPHLEYRMPVVPPTPGFEPRPREERIEMLERRIAEMRAELERLRAGDD